jgi:hypothetical protein
MKLRARGALNMAKSLIYIPSGEVIRKLRSLTGITPLEIQHRRRPTVAFGNLSLTGISLFEVIVATVILALIITGLANVFLSVKRLTLNSQLTMSGGELGEYQLSRFSDAVRQDQWDSGANDYVSGNLLRKTASLVTEPPFTLSSSPYPDRQYTPAYEVAVPPSFAAASQMRKVKVTLTWTE